ncbi:putative phosphothreonine lyase domain-containg protein [Embleya sp. NPDC059237]|uniref:putative phosphothreonine lyase domain-containing protein n=1 Tax=Embleya sp. NPDC059237 TaxID=3346784 RepID=UPI00368B6D04
MYETTIRMDHRSAPDGATPSKTVDTPWLWALPPKTHDPDTDPNSAPIGGKWLWFLPLRALDGGWRRVRKAVRDGLLGPNAKVATLGSTFRGDPTRRPVIVYTADHRDEHDVRRVLVALRDLGVVCALSYKTDEATELGHYGDGTSIYTSPAGTTLLIPRRDTRS